MFELHVGLGKYDDQTVWFYSGEWQNSALT